MRLTSDSFDDNAPIPAEFALCRPNPESHVDMARNRSPHLRWTDLPAGTESFAIICVDPDVPSKPDDVNQEGRTVPANLPRVDFYHWVLVDIPASINSLGAGEDSDGVTAKGKNQSPAPHGARRGLNNYTDWFASDTDMKGKYFGYDGPCPPWNDSIRHRYVFTVYALDCEKLDVDGDFGGVDVISAMNGHILDQASITGTYSMNPDVPA